MPFLLPPLSRRRFLATSAGLATAGALARVGLADDDVPLKLDANRVALLADTHVGADPAATSRGVCMVKHLEQVVSQVLATRPLPATAIINGDCAWVRGEPGDYATVLERIKPLREAGMSLHLLLGNHDNREHFWQSVPDKDPARRLLKDKHVGRIAMQHANLYLLDTLDEVNKTPGKLGEEQLAWLGKELKDHADKPALVFGHHTPTLGVFVHAGIKDSKPLFDLLTAHKHVKAYVFGHSHTWLVGKHEGVNLVNLPPVAYTFNKDKPSGWVDMQCDGQQAVLQLKALDEKHHEHGQKAIVKWEA